MTNTTKSLLFILCSLNTNQVMFKLNRTVDSLFPASVWGSTWKCHELRVKIKLLFTKIKCITIQTVFWLFHTFWIPSSIITHQIDFAFRTAAYFIFTHTSQLTAKWNHFWTTSFRKVNAGLCSNKTLNILKKLFIIVGTGCLIASNLF